MNITDLFIARVIFFPAIGVSFFCGLYGVYYFIQGVHKIYEFKTDRKLFSFLCIISAVTDAISLMMYYKFITLPSQYYFFPISMYGLLQHIVICMLYSFWLSPMERKYAYINAFAAIPLWSLPKIFGFENFSKMDLISGPISHLLLFCASVHFLGNLNNRTTTQLKNDPLYQIARVNIIYFGVMMITFMLMSYDIVFLYYSPLMSIIQDVCYMYAIYRFTQRTNFEIHDWL